MKDLVTCKCGRMNPKYSIVCSKCDRVNNQMMADNEKPSNLSTNQPDLFLQAGSNNRF